MQQNFYGVNRLAQNIFTNGNANDVVDDNGIRGGGC